MAIHFPSDDSVLAHLHDSTLQHYVEMRKRGSKTAAPPSREQLDALLRACFAASLEQEEGRRVEFTAFHDEEAVYADYHFRHRPELAPAVLARVSAALDPLRSYLCVTSDAGTLRIVGIRHWGDHKSFVPAGGNPSALVIRVAGPGVFAVRYDTYVVLTYWRGNVAYYPVDNTAHNDAIDSLLPRMVNADPGIYGKARDALVHVAEWMVRNRHGGTLLLVPAKSNWESLVSGSQFTALKPADRVQAALHTSVRGQEARPRPKDEESRRLALAEFPHADPEIQLGVELEWLAQLTATDGMTVGGYDLTLYGFGIFFQVSEPQLQVRVVDPYSPGSDAAPRPTVALGGARHQSAAATCHKIPGATAIVASQDGTLTVMRSDEHGQVTVRKHQELLLQA